MDLIMKNPLTHYIVLVKRWAWMVVLGVVICSGATFAVSKLIHPVYQASATLILNLGEAGLNYSNLQAGVQAIPTYAQLITSPVVLNPVVARHPGLTYQQLSAMITVKPQSNTLLIELDVENSDPRLAAQLANEVSQSFEQFSNTQLPGTIQILPAQVPLEPIRPKALVDTGIGALVGLGLALVLIIIFEWLDDRLASSEEVQELLGIEALTVIPHLPRRQRTKSVGEIPMLAEGCRILSASLNTAQREKPFKLVMITSALAGEGKSTIAVNLATFLAIEGKRVLLVDANLRNPALEQYFQLDKHPELASVLSGTWTEIEGSLNGQPTDVPNLRVLTAAALTYGSTHLLQSPWAHRLFEHFKPAPFEYIIFDTPPLLSLADAQILAAYAQVTVLVVDASKTPRKALLRVKQILKRLHSTTLGAVINKSRWTEFGEIRRYSNDVMPPPADIATALTRPHIASVMVRPPDTSAVNGSVDSDVTIILPRPHRARDEKS
jgi:polysaccharide biosynthesis transport protein